jgi:hypothetical protein
LVDEALIMLWMKRENAMNAHVRNMCFLVVTLPAAGCNIAPRTFAGTVIVMTLTGIQSSPAGSHFELWARNPYNDTVRVGGIYDFTDPKGHTTRLFPQGFVVRPAITMDDPCMIDGRGNLLVTALAYQDSTVHGVFQSAEEQAQQVRSRIGQLTPPTSCDGSGLDPAYHCGHENAALLGAIAYELVDVTGQATSAAPPPLTTCETSNSAPACISFAADAETRLAACSAYWASSPLAYTPNPLQLTAPTHGYLYGNLNFVTATPPSVFDAIRIDSNVHLKGIQELWITTELKDTVDPTNRGPVLLGGAPDPGGRRILHFDLTPPFGAAVAVSGTAALEVDLDDDGVAF